MNWVPREHKIVQLIRAKKTNIIINKVSNNHKKFINSLQIVEKSKVLANMADVGPIIIKADISCPETTLQFYHFGI